MINAELAVRVVPLEAVTEMGDDGMVQVAFHGMHIGQTVALGIGQNKRYDVVMATLDGTRAWLKLKTNT